MIIPPRYIEFDKQFDVIPITANDWLERMAVERVCGQKPRYSPRWSN
jgi:hypothetical protein